MKKQLLLFLLATAFLFLPACGENPTADESNDGAVTQYTLPKTGDGTSSWFYDKYNIKMNTIDGQWFDTVGIDTVSDWCSTYDRERKAGTLNTTYPMLVKFIKDCCIPEETCREVMSKIQSAEENLDVDPAIHLTEEEIRVVYSGDIRQINEVFASDYCIVVDGTIFTPEWLLNHPVGEYKRNGITYEQLKEKLDSHYTGLLYGYEDFLEIYESKLQELNGK